MTTHIEEEPHARMLVARTDFSVDGHTFRAGISRIRAGHELIAGYEANFEELPQAAQAMYSRSIIRNTAEPVQLVERTSTPTPFGREPSARSTPAAPAHWSDITLREYSSSSQIVRLTPAAKAQLERAVLEHSDGGETGGALFAVRGDLDLIIAGATPPSPYDERGADFFVHDEEREARCMTDDEHVVGSYHSHPISADGRPSQQDLGAWSLKRELLGLDAFIGAILTPAREADAFTGQAMGWRDPTIHLWVLRAISGQLVAEPAAIEEAWSWE